MSSGMYQTLRLSCRANKSSSLGAECGSSWSLLSFWSRHHNKRWLIKPRKTWLRRVRASYAALHKGAWVAAWGLLFRAFSSWQNVHLCGYIHNYNLPWKAMPSLWQAEQGTEHKPPVACAANMPKHQTHFISSFWNAKKGQKQQSWKALPREKDASPALPFSWAWAPLCACLLGCQFAGRWGMRTMELSGSSSLSMWQGKPKKGGFGYISHSEFYCVIVSNVPMWKAIIFPLSTSYWT